VSQRTQKRQQHCPRGQGSAGERTTSAAAAVRSRHMKCVSVSSVCAGKQRESATDAPCVCARVWRAPAPHARRPCAGRACARGACAVSVKPRECEQASCTAAPSRAQRAPHRRALAQQQACLELRQHWRARHRTPRQRTRDAKQRTQQSCVFRMCASAGGAPVSRGCIARAVRRGANASDVCACVRHSAQAAPLAQQHAPGRARGRGARPRPRSRSERGSCLHTPVSPRLVAPAACVWRVRAPRRRRERRRDRRFECLDSVEFRRFRSIPFAAAPRRLPARVCCAAPAARLPTHARGPWPPFRGARPGGAHRARGAMVRASARPTRTRTLAAACARPHTRTHH
jgi:hypothetical protein